jgi:hypothetical protein
MTSAPGSGTGAREARYQVDLGPRYEEAVHGGGEESTINPFTAHSYDTALEELGQSPDQTRTSSSAGLAGLGAAAVGQDREEGSPRTAGPLPAKRSSIEPDTLRIANPANASDLPALQASAGYDDPLRRTRQDPNRQRTFRRHEDAGRWRGGEQQEVVDLPPLYTDIHRDSASEAVQSRNE